MIRSNCSDDYPLRPSAGQMSALAFANFSETVSTRESRSPDRAFLTCADYATRRTAAESSHRRRPDSELERSIFPTADALLALGVA